MYAMNNIEKFENDIVEEIHKGYDECEIEYDSSVNDYRTVMLQYISMLNRVIGPKKRCVHISHELMSRISGTDQESKRLKGLIDDMKEKLKNGDDVNGHLSKLVFKDMNKTDKMLDDWSIYHLHLCLGSPNVFDKARTQSGDLLMAVILFDDAYFIDVTSHSNDDWFDVRYLKIIKDNWEQELLNRHDDIIDVPNLDESVSAIKEFRKAGINSFIHKIDDNYYSSKYAFGYSLAETSNKAMFSLISLNKYLEKLDFNYDHMTFNAFNINCLCTIYDDQNNSVEIIRKMP